jgi:hypothetical protein
VAHQRIPYRLLLPVIFGLVSAGLIGWALHEDAACRFYDAGRPFWPCEAPRVLLNLLSVPGVALFMLLFRWWHGYGLVWYLAEWPFVLVWWWFAGTRLDFGLLGPGRYRWRKTWIGGLAVVALALVALAAESVREDLAWHREYPDASSPLPVWTRIGLVWLIGLAAACGLAAIRLWQGTIGLAEQPLVSPSTIRRTLYLRFDLCTWGGWARVAWACGGTTYRSGVQAASDLCRGANSG